MTKEEGLAYLKDLISRFSSDIDQYRSAKYDESNTRAELIDLFFEYLGWDMYNKSNSPINYREVVREHKVKIGKTKKAPDYCFRISGKRKFFVEAKKPSVNIEEDSEPAFQVRRYAYTAKLPLAILTNFDGFAVYDTRIKPNVNDKASVARKFYFSCKQYEEKFDEIYNLFSKEAVKNGSLDKYIEENKNTKGTSEVDEDLLALIEDWRVLLAKDIAKNNPKLSIFNLNTVVQRIINRIIFLRIAEDKGIEDENKLLTAANSENVYEHLLNIFSEADIKYNSGLFVKEDWINDLTIKGDVLKKIIKNLYFPECPYVFSVLPVEILGSIYERFLGKTIHFRNIKGDTHTAIIEEKPEVKKAGGVFYTPQYIVEYIVQNTVGEKIKNKKPEEIAKIKIVDPACGSGSFLVGAYQYLLDYHLDYYTKEKNLKNALNKELIYEMFSTGANGEKITTYNLTIREKQRILTSSIFGVDIDRQAAQVTKLSLYLKLLENENKEAEAGGWLISHTGQQILPSLEDNIKFGNSLIAHDFDDQFQLGLTQDERNKVNCFTWEDEFEEIFKNGGFDIVVGNPPYTYIIPDMIQEYFQRTYKYQDYQKDLYLIFLEKYYTLLKTNGVFGVIVSNTWLLSLTYKKIRTYMTSNYRWQKILHLPDKVFDAVVDTHVLVFEKILPKDTDICEIEVYKEKVVSSLHTLPFSAVPKTGEPINVTVNPQKRPIFDRIIRECRQLKDYCNVYNGIKPFEKGKGTPPQSEQVAKEKPYVFEGKRPSQEWSPLLRGSLIHRYINKWDNDYWIKYGVWLAAPRDPAIFKAPEKIVIRQTGDSLIATFIRDGIICRNNLHIIINNSDFNILFFLALLNSTLLNFVYEIMNPEKGEALAEVKKNHVERLPIPIFDLSTKTNKTKHDSLISLVEKMLELKQREAEEPNPQAKIIITRQIKSVDNAIDKAVYELYNLSEDEIKVVEGKE